MSETPNMNFITERDLKMRARLQELTDRKDAERGRPLSVSEQLANLQRAMEHCFKCDGRVSMHTEVCPYCGQELM